MHRHRKDKNVQSDDSSVSALIEPDTSSKEAEGWRPYGNDVVRTKKTPI